MTANTCPKCGGSFGEPRYCTGSIYRCLHDSDWRYTHTHPLEHLVYACQRCGYEDLRPTLTEMAAKKS